MIRRGPDVQILTPPVERLQNQIKYSDQTFGVYSQGFLPKISQILRHQESFAILSRSCPTITTISPIELRLEILKDQRRTKRGKQKTFTHLRPIREESEEDDYRVHLLKQIPSLPLEENAFGQLVRVDVTRKPKFIKKPNGVWEYISPTGFKINFPQPTIRIRPISNTLIAKIKQVASKPTFEDPFYHVQALRAERNLRIGGGTSQPKKREFPITMFEEEPDKVVLDPTQVKYKHQDTVERSRMRNQKRLAELEESRKEKAIYNATPVGQGGQSIGKTLSLTTPKNPETSGPPRKRQKAKRGGGAVGRGREDINISMPLIENNIPETPPPPPPPPPPMPQAYSPPKRIPKAKRGRGAVGRGKEDINVSMPLTGTNIPETPPPPPPSPPMPQAFSPPKRIPKAKRGRGSSISFAGQDRKVETSIITPNIPELAPPLLPTNPLSPPPNRAQKARRGGGHGSIGRGVGRNSSLPTNTINSASDEAADPPKKIQRARRGRDVPMSINIR